ncbi:MAG: DUF2849 domain-containing protein [Pseudomonadota bacterium]
MKAVTANRLSDGLVVYFDADGQWTPDVARAARFADEDAKAALARAQEHVTQIAEAWLMDIDEQGAPSGRDWRKEDIRTKGPTVRPDLGYQAD